MTIGTNVLLLPDAPSAAGGGGRGGRRPRLGRAVRARGRPGLRAARVRDSGLRAEVQALALRGGDRGDPARPRGGTHRLRGQALALRGPAVRTAPERQTPHLHRRLRRPRHRPRRAPRRRLSRLRGRRGLRGDLQEGQGGPGAPRSGRGRVPLRGVGGGLRARGCRKGARDRGPRHRLPAHPLRGVGYGPGQAPSRADTARRICPGRGTSSARPRRLRKV